MMMADDSLEHDDLHGEGAKDLTFRSTESLQVLVGKYRLGVARMPTEALDATWSSGANRPIDHKHVEELCTVFCRGGLDRDTPRNYLRVLCDRSLFQAMADEAPGPSRQGRQPSVLDFRRWGEVHGRQRLELMAGQHRVRALDMYISRTHTSREEAWWVCEMYDQDKLPPEMGTRLRFNRREPILPDSHACIWTQLKRTVEEAGDPSRVTAKRAQEMLVDTLQLSSDVRFPTTRLIALYKNSRWRPVISRWCDTRIGASTFQISTWDWMASSRIDEFWFSAFRAVHATLEDIPRELARCIGLADWSRLAGLPPRHTGEDVHAVFYKGGTVITGRRQRRPGFLADLSDASYDDCCEHLARHPGPRFPPIQEVLRISQADAKIMCHVFGIVCAWIDPCSSRPLGRQVQNKAQLYNERDLGRGGWVKNAHTLARNRLSAAPMKPLTDGSDESVGLLLQHEVLLFAWADLKSLRDMDVRTTHPIPSAPTVDSAEYAAGLAGATWQRLLGIVRLYKPGFRPGWAAEQGRDAARDGLERILSTHARDLIRYLRSHYDTPMRPDLHTDEAVSRLEAQIRKAVEVWVSPASTDRRATPARDGSEADRRSEAGERTETDDFEVTSERSAQSRDEGGRTSAAADDSSPGGTEEPSRVRKDKERPVDSLDDPRGSPPRTRIRGAKDVPGAKRRRLAKTSGQRRARSRSLSPEQEFHRGSVAI